MLHATVNPQSGAIKRRELLPLTRQAALRVTP
jgi:hypothetical protein